MEVKYVTITQKPVGGTVLSGHNIEFLEPMWYVIVLVGNRMW